MTDVNTRVSVIIRAHNEGKHIARLLEGLSKQTRPPDEYILVDSGSTDDTVEIAEAMGCKVVRIRKEDFSFGRALNLGCEAATGDVLLIVSAHVYPIYDSYLENLLAGFKGPDVQIVYGRQVGDHRTKFSESRVMLQWFPAESIWDQGHPFSNNANAAVLKSAWSQHRYDESLTGLEDLDFAKKLLATGGRLAYMATAPVVHVHEETWTIIRNRYRREAIAYTRIMDDASMSLAKAIGLASKNVVHDYRDALKAKKLGANLVSIPRFRFAQFVGAWEGFKEKDQVTDDLLGRFYYPAGGYTSEPGSAVGRPIDYSNIDASGENS